MFGYARATADIAAHLFPNRLACQIVPLFEQSRGGNDLSRRAVAALKTIVFDERALERMQLAVRAQTFDSHNLIAVVHDRQRQTRCDAPSVGEHGACAARTLIAALLRTREMQAIAQCVEQRNARLDGERTFATVEGHPHVHAARVPKKEESRKCGSLGSGVSGC
jgi:hypothetical protein